jgi:Nucleotidyltransferase domain
MNNVQKAIEFTREFPEAVLTGSYAFGHPKEGSDLDFFVPLEAETITKLNALGYVRANETEYKDSLTNGVYRRNTVNYGIDVQVVTDMELKMLAQQFLLRMPGLLMMSFQQALKPSRKRVWDWAIREVRKQRLHTVDLEMLEKEKCQTAKG